MKSPSQIADSESDQHTVIGPYCIRFYENCSHSPASWLVPQALSEIEENGFDDRPPALPTYEEPCVAAIGADGKAMAFITYIYVSGICHITLGYTASDHRQKGIHTALFNALVERATKRGDIFSIISRTHAKNLAAQAAFEAQGRTKENIDYSFRLKDEVVGKEPTAEEMRMPEYLVEPFDTGPDGLKSLQAFINEKAAEGYELQQVVRESTCQWVLFFKREPDQA
ncbi:GNAT family N-acetyltransferase [Sinorhizobium medicae]|uniref:GNAT family N-acetyltransferase n=1 Tax=Sinorhizobium medicae TaxID=110321 RepID=UPI002AF6C95C|nr:GNAT family N-acetyltransferase [Sinorhizobium medicae]WQO60631.1 GNAT family N-acetyltransferase [Sinorhizobium medicae]